MISWALIFFLLHLVDAIKGSSQQSKGPNARLALRAVLSTRGGSIQKENIGAIVQRIISPETVFYAMRPTALVKVTLRYLQGQTDAVHERRAQYSTYLDAVRTSLFHPFRVLRLTLFAFVLVELADSLVQNNSFRSVYKENIEPLVQEGWQRADKWWSKGRREGGLFHAATWSWKNINEHPQSVIKAWNEQFSRKVQRAMGVTFGLILSPIMWTLTTKTLTFVSIIVIISEINLYVGEKIEIALQRISLRLSNLWGRVDVALETIRRTFRSLLNKPSQVTQATLENNFNETVSEEVLPISLQQGLAIGLLLGFLAGV